MRILIIAYSYYPEVNPRSIRWRTLACHWKKSGHDVSVITATNDKKNTLSDGINVIRTSENWIGLVRNKILELNQKNERRIRNIKEKTFDDSKAVKKIYFYKNIEKIIKLAYNFILRKLQWPDYAWPWIFTARRAIISHLNSSKSYNVIISVSHPFSSHLVGRIVKRKFPYLKWIIDIGDPFCFLTQSQPNNFALYYHLNKKIEQKIFQESDGIVVTTPETRSEYLKIFPNFSEKIKVVPPLLSPDFLSFINNYQKKKDLVKDLIKFVFIGTLYSKIRNPSNLLELLESISQSVSKRIEIHFFGSVIDIDTSLISSSKISIFFHGPVNHIKALNEMMNSDVLVNIGNTTKFQLPSKLVEYACTGKPILNITAIAEDSSSKFLVPYIQSKTIYIKNKLTNKIVNELVNYLNKKSVIDLDKNKYLLKKHEVENIARDYESLFL